MPGADGTAARRVRLGSPEQPGARSPSASPANRLRAGVGYIPEDRQDERLVAPFPVSENLILDTYNRPPFASGQALDLSAIRTTAEQRVKEFDIRTQSISAPVGTLSGGNQQKVILAREVGRDVRLLLASQPTRGLDVGVDRVRAPAHHRGT